jgi:hypothetical protein
MGFNLKGSRMTRRTSRETSCFFKLGKIKFDYNHDVIFQRARFDGQGETTEIPKFPVTHRTVLLGFLEIELVLLKMFFGSFV